MAGFFLNVKSKGNTNTGGQVGKDGVTPDIQIGTVITLEPEQQATVTREGTNENPIFNFGIPKGNIGDKGKPGEKGTDGVDGKSLEFNWNGTELGIRQEGTSDYQYVNLEGTRGEKGDKGEQGLPGKDGETPDMSDFENKINKQYKTIEKKIDDHIENHLQGSGNASIDDTIIASDKTWSSSKIENFVHTNDGVIWSTVQGENLSVNYTKEGYLREVEIWGNTIQNQADLSNIQHLGKLYVDSEGRKQYKIDIVSHNGLAYKHIQLDPGERLGNNRYRLKANGAYAMCNFQLNPNDVNVGDRFKIILEIESKTDNIDWEYIALNYFTADAFGNQTHFEKRFGRQVIEGTIQKLPQNLSRFVLVQIDPSIKTGEIVCRVNIIFEKESHKTTLLLPRQLMKEGNISDKLYWDSSKGRYIVEKKVDIPEGYDKIIDETLVLQTPQLIETNITKEILLPSYKGETHLFITGGIDGSIKTKAPINGGKAIQSLSAKNIELTKDVDTLSLENEKLKQMDNELVATSWDMDFRMCAIEWSLEDLGIEQELMMLENNMKGSVSNMALSRYEQAKIMIAGGVYKKITLTKQLTTYFNRGYLTQEEYDELIALMEAKDLVVEE